MSEELEYQVQLVQANQKEVVEDLEGARIQLNHNINRLDDTRAELHDLQDHVDKLKKLNVQMRNEHNISLTELKALILGLATRVEDIEQLMDSTDAQGQEHRLDYLELQQTKTDSILRISFYTFLQKAFHSKQYINAYS